MNNQYDFEIELRLPHGEKFLQLEPDHDIIVDQLYKSGCDDALVSTRIKDGEKRIYVDFSRVAADEFVAIESSCSDIRESKIPFIFVGIKWLNKFTYNSDTIMYNTDAIVECFNKATR